MIPITATLALDEREIQEEFIQAAGPGGQNVNKVATAVQLRFDVRQSPSLPEGVRARLMVLAGKRLTTDGVLIIVARGQRTQAQNRQAALDQLVTLVRKATEVPKLRFKSRPTLGSKQRRLETKRQHSEIKRQRRDVSRSE